MASSYPPIGPIGSEHQIMQVVFQIVKLAATIGAGLYRRNKISLASLAVGITELLISCWLADSS